MLCMTPPFGLSVVVFSVDRQVQREDAGQDQHVVLVGADLAPAASLRAVSRLWASHGTASAGAPVRSSITCKT
jgi:hypothetical protein